jgi:hypothetical protein
MKKLNHLKCLFIFLILFIMQDRGYSQSFSDILSSRLPSASGGTSQCMDKANQRIEQFKQQDLAKQKQLTNQLHSHQEGWIEKNPGTCERGGPPPLCPVDHWMKDPNSMNKWNAEQSQVRQERQAEINKLLNSCNQQAQQQARQKQEEDNRKQQEALQQQQQQQKDAQQARLQEAQRKYDELMEQQRLQRLREEQASNEMTNQMNANRQETDAKKDSYRQQSDLGNGYVDRSSDARSLLNPGNAANESEVFSPYTSNGNSFEPQTREGFFSNVMDRYQQFKESARESVSSFFGRNANQSDVFSDQGQDMPEQGWSFERTRLNVRVIQPLKNLFQSARNLQNQMDNYEDGVTRGYDLFQEAQPKTDKETRDDFKKDWNFMYNSVERQIGNFGNMEDEKTFNEGARQLEEDFDQFGKRTFANATGNVLGKFETANNAKEFYNNTIGGTIDKLMEKYKQFRGAQQYYNNGN